MPQSVNSAIHLAEAVNEMPNQGWVVALIQHENRVRNKVGDLQKARFLDARKVRDIAQVSQDAPARAKLSKFIDPYLSAFIESPFCEHN